MNEDKKQLKMGDFITIPEHKLLLAYLNEVGAGPNTDEVHDAIIDWLGTQPQILEKTNKAGLLLTYFAYVIEHALRSLYEQTKTKK